MAPTSSSLLHSPLLNFEPGQERKTAVAWPAGSITYNELRGPVLRIATRLRKSGIGQGCRVAVCLPKCVEAVQVILGVLASGAAYVPLAASSPVQYIHKQVQDAQAGLLVTTPRIRSLLATACPAKDCPPSVTVSGIDTGHGLDPWIGDVLAAELPVIDPEDQAAILYTSGTTGEPKGVVLSHRNILSFVEWAIARFGLSPEDRFVSHAPFYFDLSTLDLFATLRLGAAVFLLNEKLVLFPQAVAQAVRAQRCSIWYSVPTALRFLLEHGRLEHGGLPSLRTIFFAGEVFPLADLRKLMGLLPGPRYVNLYGPTETNVCTYHILPGPPDEKQAEIPIGLPCEHLEVGLRGENGRPPAAGRAGEIWVAGPSVMRGYWRRPDLTRAVRLNRRDDSFLTGDFGALGSDGRFFFRGRRDRQVKIRGHRVELTEIESVLASCPGASQAVVVGHGLESLNPRLIAFIVPALEAALSATTLRRFCAGRLPSHAVPASFFVRSGLPLLPNGKVDRARLTEWAAEAMTKESRERKTS